uniref:Uncharacterized protein n=1 Tax=Haplochromis burtoni TaxID=8153 RepID=A0A3Q2VV41_HAPBU
MLMLNCDSSGLPYYRHSSGSLNYKSSLPTQHRLPGPCTCPDGFTVLKDHIPKDHNTKPGRRWMYGLINELKCVCVCGWGCHTEHSKLFCVIFFQIHLLNRTNSILSKLLFALPNSPLQYPIQGVIVRPLTATAIPGMLSSTYASVTNVLVFMFL